MGRGMGVQGYANPDKTVTNQGKSAWRRELEIQSKYSRLSERSTGRPRHRTHPWQNQPKISPEEKQNYSRSSAEDKTPLSPTCLYPVHL